MQQITSNDYSSSSSKSARISRTWLTNSVSKVFSEHRNMLAAICVQGKSPMVSTLTGHLMSLYKAKRSLSSFRMRLALSTVGLFGNLTPFSSESNVSRVLSPDNPTMVKERDVTTTILQSINHTYQQADNIPNLRINGRSHACGVFAMALVNAQLL